MEQNPERKLSFGTKFMLVLSTVVLAGSLTVLLCLFFGGVKPVNTGTRAATGQQALVTSAPAAAGTAGQKQDTTGKQAVAVPQQVRQMTISFAGTAVLEGEVRENGYFKDARVYDFSDYMVLLKKELTADLNVVFLENILSDDLKTNNTVAPGSAADMLKNAGFQMAACGFAKAYEHGIEGIASTRNKLIERGITPLGIFESEADDRLCMAEINGFRIALLQVTDTMAAAVRKKMASKAFDTAVPAADAEEIAAEITRARQAGAQAVIVLIQWGKAGNATNKNQKLLAQKIAEAGADLIVGSGSRICQPVELLTVSRSDGSIAEVPCAWSLGTTLSGDRSAKRLGGMLLRACLTEENGQVSVSLSYTPLYTWKYKQDGHFYYRCMAASREIPDGMDGDQQKNMTTVLKNVRNAVADSIPEE